MEHRARFHNVRRRKFAASAAAAIPTMPLVTTRRAGRVRSGRFRPIVAVAHASSSLVLAGRSRVRSGGSAGVHPPMRLRRVPALRREGRGVRQGALVVLLAFAVLLLPHVDVPRGRGAFALLCRRWHRHAFLRWRLLVVICRIGTRRRSKAEALPPSPESGVHPPLQDGELARFSAFQLSSVGMLVTSATAERLSSAIIRPSGLGVVTLVGRGAIIGILCVRNFWPTMVRRRGLAMRRLELASVGHVVKRPSARDASRVGVDRSVVGRYAVRDSAKGGAASIGIPSIAPLLIAIMMPVRAAVRRRRSMPENVVHVRKVLPTAAAAPSSHRRRGRARAVDTVSGGSHELLRMMGLRASIAIVVLSIGMLGRP
mmetsp:Transcript_6870/g.20570  ORF Transcript_6870/g.20570 Transcript_6870/m.20570 type:complete len:371 (+) Transcript_6870:1952-3064(+)